MLKAETIAPAIYKRILKGGNLNVRKNSKKK